MYGLPYYKRGNQVMHGEVVPYTIVKYFFLFFPILRISRGTHRTDLFVEITNLMKGNTVWPHYTLTGYYSTWIRLS